MAWKDVLGAAFVADISGEVLKKLIFGAGEIVGKKVVQDFGGENNPVDERWDMESSRLMDPTKREIWNEINSRLNDNGGDGPIAAHVRSKMGNKRRVIFAAMMADPPTIKTEDLDDKGKVVKVTYPPLPNYKPLATEVKEYCVDMFVDEQKAQLAAGKSAEAAVNIAQQKVEIYLRDAGFPIASENNPYRHIDEFIVKVPENAVKAAKAAKATIADLKSRLPAVKQALEDGYDKFITHTDNYNARKKGRSGPIGLLSRILP